MWRRIVPAGLLVAVLATPLDAAPPRRDPNVEAAIVRALEYLAQTQHGKQGYWEATGGQYRVAMTALAGTALLAEGSTTTRGKYARNVRLAVDYLLEMASTTGERTGLIGFKDDYHYTYGHGFAMLFLSQVYGEEEDERRRDQIRRVLTRAVQFSANAQTSLGGWGYVSAKDGNDFDEGSTCITQVQGLRACRNAGIPVSRDVIDRARTYIAECTTPEGGVQYSIRGGGARPAITAAALAAMYNAGEYDSELTQKMLKYCEENVWPRGSPQNILGHWHYTHLYYAQVMYRLGGEQWERYFEWISTELVRRQNAQGYWTGSHVGPVYTTAVNATILQLGNGYLPIYQR